jgi:signal transduction histidine kinase
VTRQPGLAGRLLTAQLLVIGIGIGTVTFALVTAHGGTLTATSNGPGTGAEFTITLPGSTSS